jgi:rod shape-determining protein MreD
MILSLRKYTQHLLLVFSAYLPYVFFNLTHLNLKPDLTLITVFFLFLIKHCRVNWGFLVALGFLVDNLYNRFWGFSALAYSVAMLVARTNHRWVFGKQFIAVIMSFCIVMIIMYLVAVCMQNIVDGILPSNILWLDYIVTILLYPPLHYLYVRYNKNLRIY